MTLDDVQPPPAVLVRRRWISGEKIEYARRADAVLVEHGIVRGSTLFDTRPKARHRAHYLKQLLVDLRLHESWELREHVERTPSGYRWSVEYLGERA